ncbi:MAG: transcriptional regulator, MarR family [Clostridia bacterium]|nr:transcriptional regulator, MarR family [Clostridia bacterium]
MKLGRLMAAIHKNVETMFNKKISEDGFDTSYIQYLLVISAHNGINQNELAHKTNVNKASASKAVRHLLGNNLIERKNDDVDLRNKIVYPTEKGKQVAERFKTTYRDINKDMIKGFTESEVALLKNFLERILINTSSSENNFVLSDLDFLDR